MKNTNRILAVGLAVVMLGAVNLMAQVPMQTTQDSAIVIDGKNRLVIDGKPLFISGMNIAWNTGNSFGNDVGDTRLDENAFTDHIKNIRKAGGNSVRWWLHTDAANCPKIDSDGKVTGIGTRTIENMKTALDIAYEHGVVVSMCLFSFDLLVPGNGGKGTTYYPGYNLANNHKFLTVPENLDTYLENALKPMLEAVGNHPAVMCWEVFNEPEGMLAMADWKHVMEKVPYSDILRFTGKIAAFVHRNTVKMASTGIGSFESRYLSNYTDAKLKEAAGGDELAYLDFYMAHYYPEWQGADISPFHQTAAHWGMDRPILIGEFPGKSWSTSDIGIDSEEPLKTSKTIIEAYEHAYTAGYVGALSWSMTEEKTEFFGSYATTRPALENMFTKYKNDIMIKDVEIEDLTGDLAMKLAITGLPVLTSNWAELGTNKDMNMSGAASITFEMFIEAGSGTNLDINVVLKIGNDWDWTEGQTLKLANYEQGKWVTVTVPTSSFGASANLAQVKSLLFQYGATVTPYTGTILFDNVKFGSTVISDFDDNKAWSLAADNSAVSIVARSGGSSVRHGNTAASPSPRSQTTVRARKGALELRVAGADVRSVELFNLRGVKIAVLSKDKLSAGAHRFTTKGIAKQMAFVRVKSVDNLVVTLPVRVE